MASTAAPRAAAGGLPVFLTSFVGRERERDALLRQLQTARLVTILGPGGAGKTRLAVETARAWFDASAADAWFVDLSSLPSSSAVAPSVARALGLGDVGTPLDSVVAFLRQGRDLLLLDNCEHLIDESAWVAEQLLQLCPDLRIIATSREALGVPGERRFPVPPLDTATEAVGLFVDRARLVDPSFALTPDNVRDLAGICDRLDGLPLAVELAAASLRALSLAQLRDRLGRSKELLASPSRTAPARQRTLRGAIEWSYDLLPEQERLLFARLAVFSGGWTLEAAEGICAGDGIEEHDILPLLASLMDRSLVTLDATSGRYGMLETIREFAVEQFGEGESWRRRHAEWFTGWAEEHIPSPRRPSAPGAVETVQAEQDNLRVAMMWSLEPEGSIAVALRLVVRLPEFWAITGHIEEGRFWSMAVIEHPVAAALPDERALAVARTAVLWPVEDRHVVDQLELALVEASDEMVRSEVTFPLANRLAWFGEWARATELLEAAYRAARDAGDSHREIRALVGLARAARESLDSAEAERRASEAVNIARATGDTWGLGEALYQLGRAVLFQGRRGAEAERIFREHQEVEPPWARGGELFDDVPVFLGTAILRQGRYADAIEQFRSGLAAGSRVGSTYMVTRCLVGTGMALVLGGGGRAGAVFVMCAKNADDRPDVRAPTLGERKNMAGNLDTIRRRIGDDDFELASAEAEKLTLEEAVELALTVEIPSPAVAAVSTPAPAVRALPAGLTEREAEVLRLVASGRTNREIAVELVLSVRTVETHIFNAYAKIRAGGRAEATAWAIGHGLVAPAS